MVVLEYYRNIANRKNGSEQQVITKYEGTGKHRRNGTAYKKTSRRTQLFSVQYQSLARNEPIHHLLVVV